MDLLAVKNSSGVKNKVLVQKLKPVDLDAAVDLFEQYYAEAVEVLPDMRDEYDEGSMIETIRTYASHYQHCWYLGFVDSTRPIALCAGSLTPTPWNENILNANIDMIYIVPEHRSMDNFKTLVDYFNAWAAQFGARKITAGDIGINPDRTEKVYKHLGFEPACFLTRAVEI